MEKISNVALGFLVGFSKRCVVLREIRLCEGEKPQQTPNNESEILEGS